MPIALEGDFYVTHDLAHVTCVGIDSRRLPQCVSHIQAQQIRGVFGCPGYGFAEENLDFLAELPWLEAVWFWDISLKNVDGIYALKNLQFFGCHPKRPPIDFSRFPKLRKLVLEPKPRDGGLKKLGALELLHLWRYRPTGKDFSALELPESLSELSINWANVESLESLPALPNLRRLEVHRCRNLETLGSLGAKFPRLEYLIVAACGRVMSGEGERVVRELPHLLHAYVRDKRLLWAGSDS